MDSWDRLRVAGIDTTVWWTGALVPHCETLNTVTVGESIPQSVKDCSKMGACLRVGASQLFSALLWGCSQMDGRGTPTLHTVVQSTSSRDANRLPRPVCPCPRRVDRLFLPP